MMKGISLVLGIYLEFGIWIVKSYLKNLFGLSNGIFGGF